ncbi:hypothetical protein CDAR_287691 [Caerostris darwini]|uniref:Uncharacterized protein n=1 Tax=Caerostris darwini TaxID=1538125 RepID=A0AAV4NFD5_9ARAC|nr:hypothetical protein CDAR_287691 [Caerostris darwini]
MGVGNGALSSLIAGADCGIAFVLFRESVFQIGLGGRSQTVSPATAISVLREGNTRKTGHESWNKKKKGIRIPGVYPRIIKQKKLSQLSKVSQENRMENQSLKVRGAGARVAYVPPQ